MEIIDNEFLSRLSQKAGSCERLRMNHNFHSGWNAPSQRLLNAVEPGTVLPVHRHRSSDETILVVRGKLRIDFYEVSRAPIMEFDNSPEKFVVDSVVLDVASGTYGVNVPAGQWHTIEVFEPETVVFECKDGPYAPLGPEDILD